MVFAVHIALPTTVQGHKSPQQGNSKVWRKRILHDVLLCYLTAGYTSAIYTQTSFHLLPSTRNFSLCRTSQETLDPVSIVLVSSHINRRVYTLVDHPRLWDILRGSGAENIDRFKRNWGSRIGKSRTRCSWTEKALLFDNLGSMQRPKNPR